jgi:hypothetical protein
MENTAAAILAWLGTMLLAAVAAGAASPQGAQADDREPVSKRPPYRQA